MSILYDILRKYVQANTKRNSEYFQAVIQIQKSLFPKTIGTKCQIDKPPRVEQGYYGFNTCKKFFVHKTWTKESKQSIATKSIGQFNLGLTRVTRMPGHIYYCSFFLLNKRILVQP